MAPDQEPRVEHLAREHRVLAVITPDEYQRSMGASRRTKLIGGTVHFIFTLLSLALLILSLIMLVRAYHHLEHRPQTVATASLGEETMSGAPAGGKYDANHAPVMSRPAQSQLHQDVVRVLRTSQYKAFAALLDNMTESVIRQGITVFSPCDGALSDFLKKKTQELQLEDVVKFHVITDIMPFANLLRLEVGSRLTTDVSNITLLVTNATAGAYEVDDAVIVDPNMYTDASIAVHGINAVFNTSKIFEKEPILEEPIQEEPDEEEPVSPLNGRGIPGRGLPFPFKSRACKAPIKVDGVPVFQILLSFAGMFLI